MEIRRASAILPPRRGNPVDGGSMKKMLLAGVVAGALALPAAASATTLGGDCSLSGTATFTQPLTAVLAQNGYVFDGKGTCTGPRDPPDQVLKFTLDQLGFATEVPFRITGKNAGLAVGEATFRDSAGASTATDCGGNGVKSLGFSASTHGVQDLDG